MEEIAQAFEGPIKRPRVSLFYRLGLLVVAAAMVALPLMYVGLVGLVGWGVYFHAVNNTGILQAGISSSRGKALLVLVYAAPIVVGVILILFMVKPLFARRGLLIRTLPLKRDEEPVVFAFVEAICRQVGAPAPREIEVNCDVNAGAGLRRGLISFFGNDLKLVVGLPLVSGMSVAQLAGVLAHEFGHFSQGTAMRLTYVIRSINGWFARVVHERDAWDLHLESWTRDIDLRIGVVFYLARAGVWLTRRILWVLMKLGDGISCFMLRQMEYDADLYENALVGTDAFIEISHRMRLLSVAHEAVHYDLSESWNERRLGDDFPTLVAERPKDFEAGLLAKIDESYQKSKTSLFDTHPSNRARNARAEKRRGAGVFHLDVPATALFRDYAKTARMASMFYYTEMLGSDFRPDQLTSTEQLLSRRRQREAEEEARVAYFGTVFTSAFPLELTDVPLRAPGDPQVAVRALRDSYEQMIAQAPVVLQASRDYHKAFEKMLFARRARVAAEAGFKVNAATFGLADGSVSTADRAVAEAERAMAAQRQILDPFMELARTRLYAGLQLFLLPQAQDRLAGSENPPDSPEKTRALYDTLIRLCWSLSFVRDLQRDYIVQRILLENFGGNEEMDGLVTRIRRGLSLCHQHLKHIYSSFQSERYPFDHSEGNISVSRFIMGSSPMHEHSGEVIPKCQSTLDNFHTLYGRILSHLALQARAVEGLLGYPDTPFPVLEDEDKDDD